METVINCRIQKGKIEEEKKLKKCLEIVNNCNFINI